MGSPDGVGDQDEHPQHQVYLDAFYIDKYPVTFDQYDKFCEATGRAKPDDNKWGRGTRPIINVSWDDANSYALWAGKRLPTEAEYEKAVRGGTTTQYFFGDDASLLGDYAWYRENSDKMTHPVGEKKPNPFGLYDIVGNVWEWCSDWYADGYYAASPAKNPSGPEMGTMICLRGGSWNSFTDSSRSATRNGNSPNNRNIYGFRCAKTP
jgi:eukaryotic-like serine/threonine-protein kinase